jgi:hypothetical protein
VFMKEEWWLIVSILMLMEMVTISGWNRTECGASLLFTTLYLGSLPSTSPLI